MNIGMVEQMARLIEDSPAWDSLSARTEAETRKLQVAIAKASSVCRALLLIEPSDAMLDAAQERLCQLTNVTHFDDYYQAEMFKAMVKEAVDPS